MNPNHNTILVTGGCGFIGTSLIERLLALRIDNIIKILDNFITGTPEDLAEVTSFKHASPSDIMEEKGVFLIHGDIRDTDTVFQCTKGVDCIVHLAANTGVFHSVENPLLDMSCNVVGTVNMLEAARLNVVQKFIFASSGAPTGEVDLPIHEELSPHPMSPYGASKLAGEGYCSAYYHTFGIDTVCLRFGNVYGPRSRRKSSVIAKFIRQALVDEPCVIYGDGSQVRDFIYIDDIVRAITCAMREKIGGETFQIATGLEYTVSEVVKIIYSHLSRKGISMTVSHETRRPGDVKRSFFNTTKARKQLNWESQISLDVGIEKTIDYFLNR